MDLPAAQVCPTLDELLHRYAATLEALMAATVYLQAEANQADGPVQDSQNSPVTPDNPEAQPDLEASDGLASLDNCVSPEESASQDNLAIHRESAAQENIQANSGTPTTQTSHNNDLAASPLQPFVLAALLARDAVDRHLRQPTHGTGQPTAQNYDDLIRLDGQLRQAMARVPKDLDLANARQTVGASSTDWWWFLIASHDAEPPEHDPQGSSVDWFFNGLTVVSLALTANFAVGTFRAFSFLGLDLLGLTMTFFQGAGLTLVAGGQFTAQGQAGVERFYRWLGKPGLWGARFLESLGEGLGQRVPLLGRLGRGLGRRLSFLGPVRRSRSAKTFGASVVLVIASYAAYQNLGWWANRYYAWGKQEREQGDNIAALRSFQKALDFDPSKREAYSSLGQISEKMGRLDEAKTYYQQGLALADPASALGLARIALFQAWQESDWTGNLSSASRRDVEFLLALADQLNQQAAVQGAAFIDVVIEQKTHYGLLEIAEIDLSTLVQISSQSSLSSEQQAQIDHIQGQLNSAQNHFQRAYFTEMVALAMQPTDLEMVEMAIAKSPRGQQLARRDYSLWQGATNANRPLYDLYNDLFNTLGYGPADRLQVLQTFLESLNEVEQAALREKVIFDLGKPRCYLALTQFLNQALEYYDSGQGNSRPPMDALRQQRQATDQACGANVGPPPISTIDLFTLSIYDKTLIHQLNTAPERFLPTEVSAEIYQD